jgi:broad-specificity NMP kinase
VLVTGACGTGKSSVAEEIVAWLGWPLATAP